MEKRKLILLFLGFLLIVLAGSCYYDKEEVLYPSLGQSCDTTNVTYSKSLVHTLSLYCYSCHSGTYKVDGGGTKLDSYDDLKVNIDLVIGAINHSQYSDAMPKGAGKLSSCLIREFEIWKQAGAPNN
jgi:hypothetical protein